MLQHYSTYILHASMLLMHSTVAVLAAHFGVFEYFIFKKHILILKNSLIRISPQVNAQEQPTANEIAELNITHCLE